MADEQVIRSFLVSVGVTTDDQSIKKFDRAVEGVTKTVTAFAVAMAAAAAATAAAALKISEQFDDMFYASQRLRSSIANMKAFSFGISQMGGDAKAALNSLEGFASFMRSTPAGEGFLKGIGVNARDAAGGMREYVDVLTDVGVRLADMPYWRAQQYAQMLGIDEGTLQAMRRDPRLWQEQAREAIAATGVDMNELGERSVAAMQKIRMLRFQLELLAYRVLDAINPRVLELTVKIAAAAAAFGLIGLAIGPVATGILAAATAIGLLIDDFNVWRQGGDTLIDWDKWAPQVDKAIVAFRNLGEGLAGIGRALRDFAYWWNEAFGLKAENLLKQFVDDITGAVWSLGEAVKAVEALLRLDFKGAMTHAQNMMDTRRMPAAASSRENRARSLSGANDNTPTGQSAQDQAMAYFMRQGWTREQAAGIVANLKRESSFNPSAVGDGGKAYGLAQWHPDRQANFKAFAGKDIRESTFAEQLAFVHYELTRGREQAAGRSLQRAQSASGAAAVVSTQYERPADRLGEAALRGRMANEILSSAQLGGGSSRNVTINSSTEIRINGAADAQGVGRHVSSVIDRKNAELTRNTQAAVR